jgi:peptidoglycan/LPS O-acetylase OafA/YrhL
MKRFYLIDALRASMIFIVLAHAKDGHHIDDLIAVSPSFVVFIFNHGVWAVGLFFVISGFVVTHNLTGLPITGSLSLRFLARRSLRLDPTYWFAIALSISVAFLSTKFVVGKELPHYLIPQLVSHVFYLQGILGYDHIDPAYWTLCFEFQFYISFVLILWLGGGDPLAKDARGTRWALVSIALGSVIWPLFGAPCPQGVFLEVAYMFFFGVFAYWAFRSSALRPWFLGYSVLLAVAFAFVGNDLACFCALAALALSMVAWADRLNLGNWKFLQFLGLISYSVYLVHNPISAVVFRIGTKLMPNQTPAVQALWLAIDVTACVGFAYLVWRFVEGPSTDLARRVKLTP